MERDSPCLAYALSPGTTQEPKKVTESHDADANIAASEDEDDLEIEDPRLCQKCRRVKLIIPRKDPEKPSQKNPKRVLEGVFGGVLGRFGREFG